MTIVVQVDLTNPGQLLAACGLLEAADRRWRNEAAVTGRFDGDRLLVEGAPGSLRELLGWLSEAKLTALHIGKLKRKKPKKAREVSASTDERESSDQDEAELEKVRAAPLLLEWPHMRMVLDSWSGLDFGRTEIKTFAGQQTAEDMIGVLLHDAATFKVRDDHEGVLNASKAGVKSKKGLSIDKRQGRTGLEIGWSPDATGVLSREYPITELLAAIGLQSFRPRESNGWLFLGVWSQPLPVELARAAAACAFVPPDLRRYRFRLLGRKARSGVEGAPNDQYKSFTDAELEPEMRQPVPVHDRPGDQQ